MDAQPLWAAPSPSPHVPAWAERPRRRAAAALAVCLAALCVSLIPEVSTSFRIQRSVTTTRLVNTVVHASQQPQEVDSRARAGQWLAGVTAAAALLLSGPPDASALQPPVPPAEVFQYHHQPQLHSVSQMAFLSESWFWSIIHSLFMFATTILLIPVLYAMFRNMSAAMNDDVVEVETGPRSVNRGDGFPFTASEKELRSVKPQQTNEPRQSLWSRVKRTFGRKDNNLSPVTSLATVPSAATRLAPQRGAAALLPAPRQPAGMKPLKPTKTKPTLPTAATPTPPKAISGTPVNKWQVVRGKLGQMVLRVLGIAILAAVDLKVGQILAAYNIQFPATVVTLMGLFIGLCGVDRVAPEAAQWVVLFFSPAVAFLTRWLALMFVPMLCSIPTVASLVTSREVAGIVGLVASRCVVMTALGGVLSQLLLREAPATPPAAGASPAAPAAALPSGNMMRLLSLGVWAGVNGMAFLPEYAAVFRYLLYISAMFLVFSGSLHLQRQIGRISPTLAKLAQPVVVTSCAVLALTQALAFGEGVPFLTALGRFNTGVRLPLPLGAGDAIAMLVSPAVVAMAFGMFQRRSIVFQYLVPLLTLTLSHSALSILFTAGACRAIGLSQAVSFSVLTNSATAPLAMEATKLLGPGLPPISVAAAIFSGVIGAMTGLIALDVFNVRGVMSRGLAVGCNSHGVGTATVSQEEPASAPFSAMAFAFVGAFTVILCSVPGFKSLVFAILKP